MYFRITADTVELVEPRNVTAFHAVAPADLPEDALASGVARHGVGEVLPGGKHLMVRVDAIRRMAAGRVGQGWDDELAGMLDYAASKGWTDASGERVRAHVERE